MQEWVSFAAFLVSLFGLLIASFTDAKTRIVDDKVSYGMLIIGLALFAINGIQTNEWGLFLTAIASGIGMFALGFLLWKIGFWAGGDVKLFTGLAVLNPFNWIGMTQLFSFNSLWPQSQLPVFGLYLLLASILGMIPLGFFLAIQKLAINTPKRKQITKKIVERIPSLAFFSVFAIGVQSTANQLNLNWIFLFALIIAYLFLPKKMQQIAAIGFLLAAIWFDETQAVISAVELFIGLCVVSIFFIVFVHSKLFRQTKKISELSEGDIPAVSIVQTHTGIEVRETPRLLEIIKNLNNASIVKNAPVEREICSSQSANGLEPEQIQELNHLALGKKIPTELELKESAAFVPAVLIAFVVLNTIGDVWTVLFT